MGYESAAEQFDFPPYSTLPDITQPYWDCDPFRMVQLGDRGQILYFAAVKHGGLPNRRNRHYEMVSQGIGEFEVLTWDLERYLVVEGGERTPSDSDIKSYIAGGEGGLAAFYAGEFGYKQRCFEPEDGGISYLRAQGFPEEVIATFLFARLVPSWHRRYLAYVDSGLALAESKANVSTPSVPDFEAYAKSRISGGGSIAPSLFQDYSYKEYVAMYEAQYGHEFTPPKWHTVQFLLKETAGYMLPPRSAVHEVTIAVNGLRDRLLARGIKELWDMGVSAFVPFGYSHGLTLKNFIETLGYDIEADINEHAPADLDKSGYWVRRVQDYVGMHSPQPGVIQSYSEARKRTLNTG